MKQTKLIMGMPITVEINDPKVSSKLFKKVFDYFRKIDAVFSTYKPDSEISQINSGQLKLTDSSEEMKKVFLLAEKTKAETNGYFDIYNGAQYDPSGIVKGWAIYNAAQLIKNAGYLNYYIDAGGDIQVSGKNTKNQDWVIGIKNPFNQKEIVKSLKIRDQGVATSGTYIRGQHIYNPSDMQSQIDDIVSLTVVGLNIYEADRFATAAFAMGKPGIFFLEKQNNLEGYMIDSQGQATMTTGFEQYT